MKVALIGGSSFIGRNLILFLKKKKIYVVATYKSQKKNIIRSKYVKWKRLDISKEKFNYLKFLGYPDILINLAWADIPNYLSKNHLKTYLIQIDLLKI